MSLAAEPSHVSWLTQAQRKAKATVFLLVKPVLPGRPCRLVAGHRMGAASQALQWPPPRVEPVALVGGQGGHRAGSCQHLLVSGEYDS